jgi:hypothetical protein
MNVIIFTAPLVSAEGGSLEIHLDEIGFSTEFVTELSTTLYCPRFEQNSNWETQITLTNPSENDANIVINYFTNNGESIDQIYEFIPSKDCIDFISTEHNIEEESGSIIISSDEPLFGNIIYYSEYCAASEPLQISSSNILYCPGFYQNDEWETRICVNNVGTTSTNVTFTYYNDEGSLVDSIIDTLSKNEIRYFQPVDDNIQSTFGSVIISSTSGELNGYVLITKTDGTIGYSYKLEDNLNTHLYSIFISGDDVSNNLVLFNPEAALKTVDITFYTEDGNIIETINDQELDSYETTKIIVEDHIDDNSFGSINIDSDGNGILGYFGHIGTNYGLANSISPTTSETFYCSFNSYKEINYPSIYLTNPTESSVEFNISYYCKESGSTEPCASFSSNAQYSTKITGIETGSNIYWGFDPPSYADCMVQPPGWPGGPSEYGFNPSWWTSPDTDNDGLDDHIEDQLFSSLSPTPPPLPDTDSDGTPDGKFDPDSDGDYLPDGWEYNRLNGKQSIINAYSPYGKYYDADDDELDNWGEYKYNMWLSWDDDPSDGTLDDGVWWGGTWGNDPDSDYDGRPDGVEKDNNMDPLNNNIKWTIMVYLDGDNNLEHHSMVCFQEMEEVGSTDDITIIVQYDRISWQELYDYADEEEYLNSSESEEYADYYDDDSFDDWSDTRRYLVLEDDNKNNWESYRLDTDENLGELGMGSDEELKDFVEWGMDNFPADNNILILWDHGGGWTGCCVDYTSILDNDNEGKVLTPTDLKTSLMTATNNGNNELDIIGFDCCIMANFEILYQIGNTANLAVASENVEVGISVDDEGDPLDVERGGWPYDDIIDDLIDNHDSEWSKEDFAEKIVDNYIECWTDENLPDYVKDEFTPTMTIIKMNKLDGLEYWINKFAEELKSAMEDSNCGDHYKLDFWESKDEDYGVKEIYCYPLSQHICLYDLYQYADWWVQNCTKSFYQGDNYYKDIIKYAKQVKNYTIELSNNKCIIYEDHGDYTDSTQGPIHGLTIYLPYEEKNWIGYYDYEYNVEVDGDRDYYIDQLDFADNTNWDEMLDAKYPPN